MPVAPPPRPATFSAGMIALQGNRAEALAETVFAWLERHPLGALETEVVLVQSNGVAEWFKMALAERSGICAAAQVQLPARFLWQSYRQVLGAADVPTRSPVDKSALTWRLVQDLPGLATQPGFEPVAAFLQGADAERLWQLAGRLADLFDQYQVYRPDWLGDWAAGVDRLRSPGRSDRPVPQDQQWQPLLWRAALARLGDAERRSIRPQIHQQALARLQGGTALAAPLARRVVLFGMTHLPLPVLEMLAAIARHSQVLLAIPNPCRFHWADAIDGRELLAMARRRQPLRNGVDLAAVPLEGLHAHAHPLLAAWGRQGRDFVRQLDAFDEAAAAHEQAALPRLDLFDEGEAPDAPLLAQVQNRIRDLVPLAEHPPVVLAPQDRSIVFHCAHSALREVEVLHDQLLELLAHPPNGVPLAPRDIVVMVPDIERFAASVRAVFGQVRRSDPRFIPWGIADLSARASHPLVGALDWLLRLPQQRCTLSELQGLLDVPAIAARLGLASGDAEQLADWMAGAGIRWGLDAEQRADLGLEACGGQNSAVFGLERMLLGYAAGASSFDGIEAWDEIGGLAAELAGALASLVTRLKHWAAEAATPASPQQWAERFRRLIADFAEPTDEADRQTLQALEAALGDWLRDCDDAEFSDSIPLDTARQAWQQALDAPRLSQRFRAGGVTFCTLLPLRAIPFEVVCLLGMNDGDYPRRSPRSDFDLMALAGQARPGDRSRQGDDRQLMLEALLSARRVLYLSWVGRSARDNSVQQPSVLVSQLRDYLDAGWGEDAVAERSTEHPLQPFSRRYFEIDKIEGAAGARPWFTYAREWRAMHEARPESGEAPVPALPDGPDAKPARTTLAQLGRFVRHPARAFLRERLAVVFEPPEEDVGDDESFSVGGLDSYLIAREMLEALDTAWAGHASQPPEPLLSDALDRLARAGRLPLAGLGRRAQDQLLGELLPLAEVWQAQRAYWSAPAPRLRVLWSAEKTPDLIADSAYPSSAEGQFDSKTSAPVTLDDWIEPVWRAEDGRQAVLTRTASRVLAKAKSKTAPRPRPEKLLDSWLQALAAAASGQALHGVLVARDALLSWPPMERESAERALATVLALWQQNLRSAAPLPLPLATALAQVEGRAPDMVYDGAGSNQGASPEASEPEWERFYPDFEALAADGQFAGLAPLLHACLADWVAQQVQVTLHPMAQADAEEESDA